MRIPETSSLDAREALHQRDVAQRVGGPFGQIGIVALDRALQGSVLLITRAVRIPKTSATAISSSAERQLINERERQQDHQRGERREVLTEEIEPQLHNASVPVSITFISRPEWVPV